jgi:hypothetical protein
MALPSGGGKEREMGGLFSKPSIPKPQPVVAIPEPDDELVKQASRRRIATALSSSGRRSTTRQEAGGSLGSATTLSAVSRLA